MKNRPTYKKSLTRDQINNYLSGDKHSRRETEGGMDAFDQAAMDGWETTGNTNAMRNLDRKFAGKTSYGLYILLSAAAVAVIVAGTFIWPKEAQRPEKTVTVQVEHSDIVMEPAIKAMEALPKEEQISAATIKSDQKQLEELPQPVQEADRNEIPEIILPLKEPETKQPEKKISSQKIAKEVYYHDLKMIDYRSYRSRPFIPAEQIILTGTPANQEIKSVEEETVTRTIEIPYADFLEKTAKFIGKGKWKEALQRLEKILETYPDDVNAHFYAGLSYYNLQQYEQAKLHFGKCLQLQFSNFNEEAMWYLALSLNANAEKSKAKEVCQLIIENKGYYTKQAEKLLKDMK